MRNGSPSVVLLFAIGLVLLWPVKAKSDEQCHSVAADTGNTAQSKMVCDLSLAGGRQQRLLNVRASSSRGTIVMLPGGAGDIGINANGDLTHGNNFVVRTRDLWLARRYTVIIPDTVGGQNMRGVRASPEYALVVQDLVSFAHAGAPGTVFLLGTSQGSIAAVNGAAHLSKDKLAGVVLSEAVSRPNKSGETVFDASPDRVAVPVLIIANRSSACSAAPPEDAPRVAAAMTHAPDVRVIFVRGGVTRSSDCGSESAHGYFGIENVVVNEIAAWLDEHR
jgi:hypothetical protein